MMDKRKIAFWLNTAEALLTAAAWAWMLIRTSRSGILAASGLRSLKYYTVLSNLFNGAVAAVCAGYLARGRELPRPLRTTKLSAVTAVALTFSVVAVFLGPLYGYGAMLRGANLFFHLLLPVGAVLDFCLLGVYGKLPARASMAAALSVVIYGAGYVANILLNGLGTPPRTNDWYSFLRWGWGVGAVIFGVIILAAWGIGALLCRACRNRKDSAE